MEERHLLVAIVGPTGVGKSALAIELAQRINGEIISADSRQVYRHMDIGTAKPTPQERALVPHHMLDVADPDEAYNIALYRNSAVTAIEEVLCRGNVPILVGGTGLYVRALTQGMSIPQVQPDFAYRRELEDKATREGVDSVWSDLRFVDPVAADRIGRHNLRRMIRALEVRRATGVPFSEHARETEVPWDVLTIGLTMDREELYRRIDRRVDCMMEQGLLAEVQRLVDMGCGWELPSMYGLGYRQIGEYLRGEVPLEEAVQRIKYQTHRYARQQYAWFRLDDPNIRWFVASKSGIIDEVFDYILLSVKERRGSKGK